MKTRKNIITVLTLCAALSLTACTGKETKDTTDTQTTDTAANTETDSTDAAPTPESSSEINDLFQQENQLFADHQDEWNKAFAMANKSSADPSGNYGDYLADLVDSNKDEFTEEELEVLHKDIETIRGIEEKIAALESAGTPETAAAADSSDADTPFKNFSATDYDGNKVDDSLFSNNAVTVLNFWFTGCKPCVGELSKLNEMNEAIKSMGGEVVGINTETFDGNESAIEEAKKVLESQGAKYRNLSLTSDSDAGKYASNIMAFPTTVLVDRNGNIIGEQFMGGVDDQENYDALMKQIQAVIDADSAK